MTGNRALLVRATFCALFAIVWGFGFYLAGSGIVLAVVVTGIGFAFFGGLIAYGYYYARRRQETDRTTALTPFSVGILVLALAAQITSILDRSSNISWVFVVAMGIVALASQIAKRR